MKTAEQSEVDDDQIIYDYVNLYYDAEPSASEVFVDELQANYDIIIEAREFNEIIEELKYKATYGLIDDVIEFIIDNYNQTFTDENNHLLSTCTYDYFVKQKEFAFVLYDSLKREKGKDYYTFLHLNIDEIVEILSHGNTFSYVKTNNTIYKVKETINEIVEELIDVDIPFEIYDENGDKILNDDYDLNRQDYNIKIN